VIDRLLFHRKKTYTGNVEKDISLVTGQRTGEENLFAQRDYEKFIEPVLKLIPPLKSLDVGCGYGRLTDWIPNCSGIDLSESLIFEAKKRYPHGTFFTYRKDPVVYPIATNSINFLFSYASFIHIKTFKELEENLKEIERVLTSDDVLGVAHINFRLKPARTKSRVIYFKQFSYFLFLIFQSKSLYLPYIKLNNSMDGIVVSAVDLLRIIKGSKLDLFDTQTDNSKSVFLPFDEKDEFLDIGILITSECVTNH
jgi:SAM-dependent methyltransferase